MGIGEGVVAEEDSVVPNASEEPTGLNPDEPPVVEDKAKIIVPKDSMVEITNVD